MEGTVHVETNTWSERRLKTFAPDYKQWLTIIDDILLMENLTYRLKKKEDYFAKAGGKGYHINKKRHK